MTRRLPLSGSSGFTLVEAMVALGVLAVGLLSLASVMSVGLKHMADAPTDLVARQKATEAVESVYTARDTRVLTWAQIRNTTAGGVFVVGPQPIRDPGPDGLVNTADDGAEEAFVQPGPDALLGTADDVRVPLSQYRREIVIRDISTTLRQITVTVTVQTGNGTRNYTITTLISSFA